MGHRSQDLERRRLSILCRPATGRLSAVRTTAHWPTHQGRKAKGRSTSGAPIAKSMLPASHVPHDFNAVEEPHSLEGAYENEMRLASNAAGPVAIPLDGGLVQAEFVSCEDTSGGDGWSGPARCAPMPPRSAPPHEPILSVQRATSICVDDV